MPSKHFGTRAAHAKQVEPFGSGGLSLFPGWQGQSAAAIMPSKRRGSVAVNNNVYLVFLQKPHIYTGQPLGEGVPNRISEISVATIEPPHPSARAVREHCFTMLL